MRGPVRSGRGYTNRTFTLRDTPCGYCFEEWATCWDHIKPVSHGGSSQMENLYPSCSRCNQLVHNKLFKSLEEKRTYVQEELKKQGEWHTADEMSKLRKKV